MFFSPRARSKVHTSVSDSCQQPLLPQCYSEFRGSRIHNLLEHPAPDGDRIYMRVPYASCACAKELGAKWDPDARRWWHWSRSTKQLVHYNTASLLLETLAEVHAQSVFAEWPMDEAFMRQTKGVGLNLDDSFDYSNPSL